MEIIGNESSSSNKNNNPAINSEITSNGSHISRIEDEILDGQTNSSTPATSILRDKSAVLSQADEGSVGEDVGDDVGRNIVSNDDIVNNNGKKKRKNNKNKTTKDRFEGSGMRFIPLSNNTGIIKSNAVFNAKRRYGS